jgi:hypothetical protein
VSKRRENTRRHLHRIERAAADAAKVERSNDSGFRYRHDAEMKKMLKGVDLDRYEQLCGE